MSIRIALVDDHDILRAGLRRIIETQQDMLVQAEAGTASEALQLFQSQQFDIVILDLELPDGDGLDLLQAARRENSETRFLILTMHDDPKRFKAAVQAGAAGYLIKSAAFQKLLEAIRTIHQGLAFFLLSAPPLLADAGADSAVRSLGQRQLTVHGPESPLRQLSEREREIMAYVAQGHTSQAIAGKLFLSRKTIESYRSKIMQKLGISKRAELVQLALEHGIGTSYPLNSSIPIG